MTSDFHAALRNCSWIEVSPVSHDVNAWSVRVRTEDVEAWIFCNTDLRVQYFGKPPRPYFGNCVIMENGYGDHIKGTSATERVAYVKSWLIAKSESLRPKTITPSSGTFQAVEIAAQLAEWKLGVSVNSRIDKDRGFLELDDGENVGIVVWNSDDALVHFVVDGVAYPVFGENVVEHVSSLMGTLDGLSHVTDE